MVESRAISGFKRAREAVRKREAARKIQFGTSSAEFGQVSPTGRIERTPSRISQQFFPKTELTGVSPELLKPTLITQAKEVVTIDKKPTQVEKVVSDVTKPVPKELFGTTTAEFGQVSPTGEVEFTPKQIVAGRGGAQRREPTPLYTQFAELTPTEKLRKAELEEVGELSMIGIAGFKGFESIVVSTATGLVGFGKGVVKGVVKEFIDIQEFGRKERGVPFTKRFALPGFAEYVPEKPVLLKVGEGIVPTGKFIVAEPVVSLAIGAGFAGAIGREVLRKPVTTTLEFAGFAGLGRLPKLKAAALAAKETAVLRTRFSLRTGTVQLTEIKPTPTPTFPFKQVKGEFVFGKAGEIVGRQTKLREADIVKSIITSPQAEFRKPLLAEAKATKELDQYLGKWLPRPLSPEQVATVRKFEGDILSDKVKFQAEFKPQFEGEFLGGRLSFKPELKPPEEVFPVKVSKLRRIWPKGKRAELISETILREDPFAKFETDFFTRIPKPKPAIATEVRFAEVPRIRTRLGTSAALALAQRQAQLPKQMLKQIPVADLALEQLFMPITEPRFDVDIMPRQKLREEILPRQIVVPKLRTELLFGGAPTPTDFGYPKIDIPKITRPEEFKFPFPVRRPRLKQVKRKEAKEFGRMFRPSPTLIAIEQQILGKGFKFATGFETIRPIPIM